MEESTQSNQKPHAKFRHIKVGLLLGAVLILSIVGVFGVYSWQHGKLKDLQAGNTALGSKISTLNKTVTDLNTEVAKQKSEVAKLQAAKVISSNTVPKITVSKATQYLPDGSRIAVEITLDNTTSSPLTFSTPEFKLKDGQNQAYVAYNIYQSFTDTTLPDGYTVLMGQTLAPGENVKGTLEFPAPQGEATDYTLTYGAQSYEVTLSYKH